MIRNLLLLLALNISVSFFAQEKSIIEIKVKQYTKKVDSITNSEKKKMDKEMEAIETDAKNGKITDEQSKSRKKEIANKYEKIINEKIENEKADVEEITKITVNSAVLGKRIFKSDTIIQKDHMKYLKRNYLDVSYAFLNLTKEKGSINPFEEDSEMRIGKSHSFEIQLRRQRQLFGKTSGTFINYGLAYRSDTYMPKRPQVFVENNQNLMLENFTLGDLKRSKFRNIYITFPVDFQFVLNPKYVDYKGEKYLDAKQKQWKIGVGAYAGINTRSIIKVKYYREEDGKFDKYQDKTDNGVNSFLFGGKLSLSYGGFNIFIKKDFTPIFNDKALLPNKNGIQIGIDITNLSF